jgi:methionine synthase I (cobalamin-dependent)/5,10-methylenetetrahydrofolate reductase
MDGAMGTELYTRGVFVNVSYDGLNLETPDIVEAIHRDYVAAGAEIVETNTFGANPVKLSSHGLADRTEEINRVAVELARRATGGNAAVAVAGAVGPLGIRIEPFGPTSREEAQVFYQRQIDGLLEGGVDGFILETFSDLNELEQAFRAIRNSSELPIFCQITVGEDGRTSYGTSPEAVASEVTHWGADVIGLNCSVGPAVMLDAVERMAKVTDRPLSAQPNAGLPRAVGDRKIYLASPEYMAQYAQRMIDAGALFVGGCCGTSPDHVRKIRTVVASAQASVARVRVGDRTARAPDTQAELPIAKRSDLGRRLSDGDFVASLEIVPPMGWDPHGMLAQCRDIQEAGADCVNVLDSPHARSRMSALPAALLIQQEVGIETIVHYPCRDRNMPRMISDLLGAAAGGIRNLLIVTGRPPTQGPYPDSTAVLDIDSIGLTNVVHGLNRGVDPGGNTIGGPTRFVIGVRVNPVAVDQDQEIGRFRWKADAGAHFVVTPPLFAPERLRDFLGQAPDLNVPVMVGLRPLTSLVEAEFLHNEVPGIEVPEEVLGRMEAADTHGPDAARAKGVQVAIEVLEQVRDLVAGVHIGVPADHLDAALAVLAGLEATG